MNPLDTLFCILFEYYENRRKLNPRVNPWFQVISILALSFTFWVMLAGALTLTRNALPAHIKLIALALIFIYFIFGYSLYLIFVRNNRYLQIIRQYQLQVRVTPVFKKILSWTIVIIPILLFFVMVLIHARK